MVKAYPSLSPLQEYDLASTHCYGRYLTSVGLGREGVRVRKNRGGDEGKAVEGIWGYTQGLSDDRLIVPAVSY